MTEPSIKIHLNEVMDIYPIFDVFSIDFSHHIVRDTICRFCLDLDFATINALNSFFFSFLFFFLKYLYIYKPVAGAERKRCYFDSGMIRPQDVLIDRLSDTGHLRRVRSKISFGVRILPQPRTLNRSP